ncbi:chymotrypsin-1 [Stomoxys calcitrans]|uniref:chymotrypsin-1 n=1 Tax=Stomoxys calcitrans TaxID=35570 RepID=UPI0027E39B8A|nr:chymotrypsin-1 [Stomoxys calcitrans]
MAGTRQISLALFVGLVLAIAVVQAGPTSRILGGSDAAAAQYPHSVSIRVDDAHVCGGTIVSEKYILTAAHCVSEVATTSIAPSRVNVRVGSINQFAGGQIVPCQSVVIHPNYGSFLHDIAIVGLSEPLQFNDKVNKVSLAFAEDVFEEGTPVTVTGWGLQESGSSPYKLQHVTMSVLSGPECELQAGYGYDSVICLDHPENTGFCRGDDGAGVVSGTKLIGVASFSFGNCGTKYPDVSSKVSFYREWIDGVMA